MTTALVNITVNMTMAKPEDHSWARSLQSGISNDAVMAGTAIHAAAIAQSQIDNFCIASDTIGDLV